MFIKHYFYAIKRFVKNPSLFFWSLSFPFLLGTMFFMGFGNLLKGNDKLEAIPVAVVTAGATEDTAHFQSLLDTLSDSENQVLTVTETSKKEAETLLTDGNIDGILTLSDNVSLTVSETGINQTILKNIVDIYERKVALFSEVVQTNPQSLDRVSAIVSEEISYLDEISLGSTKTNGNAQYFYALIAMTCLYGCFYGLMLSTELQANLSTLAMRRCSAPIQKLKTILCDFLAALTIEFGIILLLFAYLNLIIGVDFGNHLPLTVLTAFVGCVFGISFGTFVGSVTTKPFQVKIGITLAFSMVMSFLSGLMFSQMPNIIEKNVPIVNRLNPALLLSNSFYCLTFYDNYHIYTRNMITLAVISVSLCLGSVLLLRRKKYASL